MRRRGARSRVSHDRWLVSYADFITLLFGFFVVLYAFAQADQKKQAQMADGDRLGLSLAGHLSRARRASLAGRRAGGIRQAGGADEHRDGRRRACSRRR